MSDLIDRQAAIDALADYLSKTTYTSAISFLNTGALILARVPSAQPEQAIKDCRNCKYGKYNDHYDASFCYNADNCTDWDKWESVQPERKTGQWIKIRDEEGGNALYECSECHSGEVHVPIVEVPYCWKCGAKMEVEHEQDD